MAQKDYTTSFNVFSSLELSGSIIWSASCSTAYVLEVSYKVVLL